VQGDENRKRLLYLNLLESIFLEKEVEGAVLGHTLPKHVGQHCPGAGGTGRAQVTAGHFTGEQDTEPR
jgi:hypothetical protein